MKKFITLLLVLCGLTPTIAAEPADQFSRANCFNNESITYNYFDPPEERAVFSWHRQNGVMKHYVTDNPPNWWSCRLPFLPGYAMVVGVYCNHYTTMATRHAGVHGAFLSSEPNPDGVLIPGITTGWKTNGVHTTIYPGIGFTTAYTSAEDCNLHFDQIY